jgi:hypothetical protein
MENLIMTLKKHLYYLRYTSKPKSGWRLFWSRNPVKYVNEQFPDQLDDVMIVEFKKII